MGKRQSRPSISPLTDEPWRKTKGWNEEVKCNLKEHVAGLAPEIGDDLQIPFYNILLTGQIRAGKSSFYNSLSTVFRQRVVRSAEVGNKAFSLTKDYRVYEMKVAPNAPPLAFRICDTMGLDHTVPNEIDIRNILKAADGHVPDGFVFDRDSEIVSNNPKYIDNPSLTDKAHCVAVVVDASKATVMENRMWEKLRSLRSGLIDRQIPTFILLTHIDQACPEVCRDVTKVYNSKAIRDLVTKVGKMLHGLPENQIFPVINYIEQIEMDNSMDILLLTALRQMLYSAQGYLFSSHEHDERYTCVVA